MNITVHGVDTNISPAIKEYAEKKLSKLPRYLPNIVEARLELKQNHKKNNNEQFIAQLTVRNIRGVSLRAEDKKEQDFRASIDVVMDKMYRQIERYKGKTKRRKNNEKWLELDTAWEGLEATPLDEAEAESPDTSLDYDGQPYEQVVRRKEVLLTPMSEPEAIDQMEMLGHSFFLFYNGAEDTVNVLYKREDGQYGILTPLID